MRGLNCNVTTSYNYNLISAHQPQSCVLLTYEEEEEGEKQGLDMAEAVVSESVKSSQVS